ncbi:MAG: AmmeMemoRadiSam system protein A [Anaerolineae bacterium]|nr:AmmeMemoRadiSam system protein A [Anaerolineae bacterium]
MAEKRIASLSSDERRLLLKLAREAIEAAAAGKIPPPIELANLPAGLREPAACFVTLHIGDELRGCTGTLIARAPLAEEVIHTAAQTALSDPRFAPVTPAEAPSLDIEISVLTPPQKLNVPAPDALPKLIRPGIDGVTLSRGLHRATFLPQVWDKIPDPITFLDMLSQKMGLSPKAWLMPGMQVEVYQVEEFSERGIESNEG